MTADLASPSLGGLAEGDEIVPNSQKRAQIVAHGQMGLLRSDAHEHQDGSLDARPAQQHPLAGQGHGQGLCSLGL